MPTRSVAPSPTPLCATGSESIKFGCRLPRHPLLAAQPEPVMPVLVVVQRVTARDLLGDRLGVRPTRASGAHSG